MASGDILLRGLSNWGKLSAGSEGQQLTVSGGSLAWSDAGGGSSANLTAIRDQLMYLYFKKDAAQSYQQLNGVFFDSFTDANGVDTANCANISRNAANYYAPNGGYIIDSCSNAAANINQKLYNTSTIAFGQAVTIASPKVVNSLSFELLKFGNPTGSATATIYTANGSVGANAVANVLVASSNGVVANGISNYIPLTVFNFATPPNVAAGNYVFNVEYGGGDGENLLYVHLTSNTAHYGNADYKLGSTWNSYATYDTVFAANGGAANATLISNSFTASAQPSSARCSLFANCVDSVTLNTDLMAYASSNNGTTWDAITLASVANLPSSIKQFTGQCSLTGANTAMRLKIATANNKNVQITAWGLAWY